MIDAYVGFFASMPGFLVALSFAVLVSLPIIRFIYVDTRYRMDPSRYYMQPVATGAITCFFLIVILFVILAVNPKSPLQGVDYVIFTLMTALYVGIAIAVSIKYSRRAARIAELMAPPEDSPRREPTPAADITPAAPETGKSGIRYGLAIAGTLGIISAAIAVAQKNKHK